MCTKLLRQSTKVSNTINSDQAACKPFLHHSSLKCCCQLCQLKMLPTSSWGGKEICLDMLGSGACHCLAAHDAPHLRPGGRTAIRGITLAIGKIRSCSHVRPPSASLPGLYLESNIGSWPSTNPAEVTLRQQQPKKLLTYERSHKDYIIQKVSSKMMF